MRQTVQGEWTVSTAAEALRSGDVTSVELVQEAQARADRLDPILGTYLARFDDASLEAAKQRDDELASGIDRGPLHGIPVGVKDIITTVEGPTTAQSLVLKSGWGDRTDAPVVARLRAAGAVIVGKTTTMEFAIGLPDPEKPFPLPRNPWNTGAWTGGSSSGTANGVAAGLFMAGLGTDTGGSIRVPAAYCGITGLKPTFGRVPKSGCVPLGYSLDHIGPMARSAWDCAAMLGVLAGHHPDDPTASREPVPDYTTELDGSLTGVRVGMVRGAAADLEPSLVDQFDSAVEQLGSAGARVVEVSLAERYRLMRAASLITSRTEAFGYHRDTLGPRWDDYGRPTRQVLALGALVSGSDYVAAQQMRIELRRWLEQLFAELDVIVMPTTLTAAPSYGDLDVRLSFLTSMTSAWNLTGLPALSVPIGFTAEGLPTSMQIVGRPFEEAAVLGVGHAYQQLTDWHLRVPPLAAEHEAMCTVPESHRASGGAATDAPESSSTLDRGRDVPTSAEVRQIGAALSGVRIEPGEDELSAMALSARDLTASIALVRSSALLDRPS